MNESKKSLLSCYPEIASEWNYELNSGLLPENVSAGSKKKVWWKCSKGHEWDASIYNRTGVSKTGCPICSGRRVVGGINDLASLFPMLASEWNYDKNGDFTPDKASPGMGKKVWWKCSEGHEWQAIIQSRVRGNGCPYCGNAKVLKGFNDLASKNPELLLDWDFKNNTIDPSEVLSSSSQRAWWVCHKCMYSWQSKIYTRTYSDKPTGCPACAGKVVINGKNDFETNYPELIPEWNIERNKGKSPKDYSAKSGKKVWWKCKSGHEWESAIVNRAKGKGCPYCARIRTLEGYNDLETMYPELLKEWDYTKNEVAPNIISARNSQKVWWVCDKGHRFAMRISNRTKGHGCPYCAGQKPIVGENDLFSTNPELIKEWHPTKNTIKPQDVMRFSEKVVWWIGECGHEWQSKVVNRAVTRTSCPICSSAGTSFPEQAIFFYLSKIYNKIENRYNCDGTELDIYISELSVGIEYDGVFFHDGPKKLSKDNQKDEYCCTQGIKLIRIREKGLEKTSGAINIIRGYPFNDESLEKVIKQIIEILPTSVNLDIDITRDYGEIKTSYMRLNREKSIGVLFPECEKEWDQEKNDPLTVFDVRPGSNRKAWWKCDKGHTYQRIINLKVRDDAQCPYCSGKKVIEGLNDIFTLYPLLKEEWDFSKNISLNPRQLSSGSGKKVWWKCRICGYAWNTSVSNRAKETGTGCPACAGKAVFKGYNDLESNHPEVVAFWDFDKNTIPPSEIVSGSEKIMWWKCSKGHSFSRKVFLQVERNSCPICANRLIISGINDFKSNCLDLASEWNYEKNKQIFPDKIGAKSKEIVWWKCKCCGAEWKTSIRSRTENNSGCPECAKRRVGVRSKKPIMIEQSLLFLYPELSKEWNYDRNGNMHPEMFYKSSRDKVWWKCVNGHEWQAMISQRVRMKSNCPYCSGRYVIEGENDLESQNPGIALEWNYEKNEELKPSMVSVHAGKKVWWKCSKGHEWQATVSHRTCSNTGCPICSGRKVISGENDLEYLYPEVAKEWNYERNGVLMPSMVTGRSGRKVWWKCSEGHEWQAYISNRTLQNNKCPTCRKNKVKR